MSAIDGAVTLASIPAGSPQTIADFKLPGCKETDTAGDFLTLLLGHSVAVGDHAAGGLPVDTTITVTPGAEAGSGNASIVRVVAADRGCSPRSNSGRRDRDRASEEDYLRIKAPALNVLAVSQPVPASLEMNIPGPDSCKQFEMPASVTETARGVVVARETAAPKAEPRWEGPFREPIAARVTSIAVALAPSVDISPRPKGLVAAPLEPSVAKAPDRQLISRVTAAPEWPVDVVPTEEDLAAAAPGSPPSVDVVPIHKDSTAAAPARTFSKAPYPESLPEVTGAPASSVNMPPIHKDLAVPAPPVDVVPNHMDPAAPAPARTFFKVPYAESLPRVSVAPAPSVNMPPIHLDLAVPAPPVDVVPTHKDSTAAAPARTFFEAPYAESLPRVSVAPAPSVNMLPIHKDPAAATPAPSVNRAPNFQPFPGVIAAPAPSVETAPIHKDSAAAAGPPSVPKQPNLQLPPKLTAAPALSVDVWPIHKGPVADAPAPTFTKAPDSQSLPRVSTVPAPRGTPVDPPNFKSPVPVPPVKPEIAQERPRPASPSNASVDVGLARKPIDPMFPVPDVPGPSIDVARPLATLQARRPVNTPGRPAGQSRPRDTEPLTDLWAPQPVAPVHTSFPINPEKEMPDIGPASDHLSEDLQTEPLQPASPQPVRDVAFTARVVEQHHEPLSTTDSFVHTGARKPATIPLHQATYSSAIPQTSQTLQTGSDSHPKSQNREASHESQLPNMAESSKDDPAAPALAAFIDPPPPPQLTGDRIACSDSHPATHAAPDVDIPVPQVRNPQPVRDVTVHLTSDSQRVDVKLVDRAGELHVAVHSADPVLNTDLRDRVHDLIGSLDKSGFHTDTWPPADTSRHHSDVPGSTSQAAGDQPQPQSGDDPRQQGRNPYQPEYAPFRRSNSSNNDWVDQISALMSAAKEI